MLVDTEAFGSMTEANQIIPKVSRLVDESGSAVILKNNISSNYGDFDFAGLVMKGADNVCCFLRYACRRFVSRLTLRKRWARYNFKKNADYNYSE